MVEVGEERDDLDHPQGVVILDRERELAPCISRRGGDRSRVRRRSSRRRRRRSRGRPRWRRRGKNRDTGWSSGWRRSRGCRLADHHTLALRLGPHRREAGRSRSTRSLRYRQRLGSTSRGGRRGRGGRRSGRRGYRRGGWCRRRRRRRRGRRPRRDAAELAGRSVDCDRRLGELGTVVIVGPIEAARGSGCRPGEHLGRLAPRGGRGSTPRKDWRRGIHQGSSATPSGSRAPPLVHAVEQDQNERGHGTAGDRNVDRRQGIADETDHERHRSNQDQADGHEKQHRITIREGGAGVKATGSLGAPRPFGRLAAFVPMWPGRRNAGKGAVGTSGRP